MEAVLVGVIIIAVICVLCKKGKCGICGKRSVRSPFPRSFGYISHSHKPFNTAPTQFYCPECEPKIVAAEKAILRAQNHDPLSSWPETYKGRIPVVEGSERPFICSDWRREKDSAINQLLLTAAFLHDDCNAIKEMSYDKSTGQEGNYKYTQWRASGVPCQVRK